MVFSSMIFIWIFLPVALLGNLILYKIGGNKLTNIFLLVVSMAFYAWGEPRYIFLMLFAIGMNWGLGIMLEKANSHKKWILSASIILNLSLLGYFKYAGMFVDIINSVLDIKVTAKEIALPIGISFFTFQALSYVVDVYRGECEVQHNPLKLALYISFFPQLIAGPIVKYKDVNEQIDNRRINYVQTADGIRRFIYGVAKKVLISNTLASCVDAIYALEIRYVTGGMALCASIMYTFQIYYDFSGYSDMAIGLGKMFGFEFKENFRYPYTSLSIREFWRRWHISLSSWFKEYVYIPLGGNKKGTRLTYENLFIVFFLTGMWHGASYNFIFWGLFHGVFSILERLGLGKILKKNKLISWIYMFSVVNIGWIFFRIENIKVGLAYIKRIFMPWKYMVSEYSLWEFIDLYTIFIVLCAIVGMGFIQRMTEKNSIIKRWKHCTAEILFSVCIFLLSIFSLASNTYNPFIYFRF